MKFNETTEERLQCNEPNPRGSGRCSRPRMHEGPCSWAAEWCNNEGPNSMRCQLSPGHTGLHSWRGNTTGSGFTWQNTEISRPLFPHLDPQKILERIGARGPKHRGHREDIRISTEPEGERGLYYFYDKRGVKISARGLSDRDLVSCETDEPVPVRPGAYDPMERVREHAKNEEEWYAALLDTLTTDHHAEVMSDGEVYTIVTDRGETVRLSLELVQGTRKSDPTLVSIKGISLHVGEQIARFRVTGVDRFNTSDEEYRKRRTLRRTKQ